MITSVYDFYVLQVAKLAHSPTSGVLPLVHSLSFSSGFAVYLPSALPCEDSEPSVLQPVPVPGIWELIAHEVPCHS